MIHHAPGMFLSIVGITRVSRDSYLIDGVTTGEVLGIVNAVNSKQLTYERCKGFRINGTYYTKSTAYIGRLDKLEAGIFFVPSLIQSNMELQPYHYKRWALVNRELHLIGEWKPHPDADPSIPEELEEDSDVVAKAQSSVADISSADKRIRDMKASALTEQHGAGSHDLPEVVSPEQYLDRFVHQQSYRLVMAIEAALIKSVPNTFADPLEVVVVLQEKIDTDSRILDIVRKRYTDVGWASISIQESPEGVITVRLLFA